MGKHFYLSPNLWLTALLFIIPHEVFVAWQQPQTVFAFSISNKARCFLFLLIPTYKKKKNFELTKTHFIHKWKGLVWFGFSLSLVRTMQRPFSPTYHRTKVHLWPLLTSQQQFSLWQQSCSLSIRPSSWLWPCHIFRIMPPLKALSWIWFVVHDCLAHTKEMDYCISESLDGFLQFVSVTYN